MAAVALDSVTSEAEWMQRAPKGEKELGGAVVVVKHVSKYYTIPGSDEKVRALEDIHLAPDSEFYPIRR